jgi:hypothetical protein
MTALSSGSMRFAPLGLVLLLSGCMPGCGGESAPAEDRSAPVRLPSGVGDDDLAAAPDHVADDLAEPPPVEPPAPLPAAE